MNAYAGIRPKAKGFETRPRPPQLFSLAFAVGVICFPVGVQPPQPPANFYPECTVKANYCTDRHEASRGLSATAELLVLFAKVNLKYQRGLFFIGAPRTYVQRGAVLYTPRAIELLRIGLNGIMSNQIHATVLFVLLSTSQSVWTSSRFQLIHCGEDTSNTVVVVKARRRFRQLTQLSKCDQRQ